MPGSRLRLRRLRFPHKRDTEAAYKPDTSEIKFLEACLQPPPQSPAVGAPSTPTSPTPVWKTGTFVILRYVKQRIVEHKNLIEPLLGVYNVPAENDASYEAKVLRLSAQLMVHLRTLTPQTTIDDLVQWLFDEYGVSDDEKTKHKDLACQFVFACVGWITLSYSSVWDVKAKDFEIVGRTNEQSRPATLTRGPQNRPSGRPVGALLRVLGAIPIACPPQLSSANLPQLLSASNLNVYTLENLGDVTVVWTTDLSRHAQFIQTEQGRRELFIFCLPSLCAYLATSFSTSDAVPILSLLTKAHTCRHGCDRLKHDHIIPFMFEILLSYRLFFGQDKRSISCYRSEARPRLREMGQGHIDPLLDNLCASTHIRRDFACLRGLRERSVYNSTLDFPTLGQSLMEIQEYSVSQKPRKLLEVFNDRRDPPTYWAFWAVVVVGGCSVVIGILQLAVGIGQLVVAARSPN